MSLGISHRPRGTKILWEVLALAGCASNSMRWKVCVHCPNTKLHSASIRIRKIFSFRRVIPYMLVCGTYYSMSHLYTTSPPGILSAKPADARPCICFYLPCAMCFNSESGPDGFLGNGRLHQRVSNLSCVGLVLVVCHFLPAASSGSRGGTHSTHFLVLVNNVFS